MSREIKIRAWSNEYNRYCDLIKMDEDDRWYGYIYSSAVYFSTKDIILEQYTGLKDKNGKEIYEGDIVTLIGEWEKVEKDDLDVVTFRDGCFIVGDDYKAGSYLIDWRVIGNIHENPELLGGEE